MLSGAHVQLWRDRDGQIRIRDLHSTNGTYVQRSGQVERLVGVGTLGRGDMFFLGGEEVGKFEVVGL